MDSAPNYASLTPQYTASEVARTEHLKERPRHTEPATFGIFLLHILHRHIHIPRHGKLSGFEQLSMKNPTCRTLPGSQHVTSLPRATTSLPLEAITPARPRMEIPTPSEFRLTTTSFPLVSVLLALASEPTCPQPPSEVHSCI